MNVYDSQGRLISSGSENRDLQSANVRRKQLRLFRGYRGLVKAFTLLSERVKLPYEIAHASSTRGSCIA